MKKQASDEAPRPRLVTEQDYYEEAWRLKSGGMTFEEVGKALGVHESHAQAMYSLSSGAVELRRQILAARQDQLREAAAGKAQQQDSEKAAASQSVSKRNWEDGGFRVDARAFDIHSLFPEALLTGVQILEGGSRQEILAKLEELGSLMAAGIVPFDAELKWIGKALQAIGAEGLKLNADGKDRVDRLGRLAAQQFGLTTKRKTSLQEMQNRIHMLHDLQAQGLPRDEALLKVCWYDPFTNSFPKPEQEDQVERAREAFMKSMTRTAGKRKPAKD